MYKTNLSYEQLQRYIGFLVNENLLKHIENKNKKLYQVTEHGEKFLGQYKKLIQILNEGNTNILNEANTHISQIEA
jgi:predicted transcriptional regulator